MGQDAAANGRRVANGGGAVDGDALMALADAVGGLLESLAEDEQDARVGAGAGPPSGLAEAAAALKVPRSEVFRLAKDADFFTAGRRAVRFTWREMNALREAAGKRPDMGCPGRLGDGKRRSESSWSGLTGVENGSGQIDQRNATGRAASEDRQACTSGSLANQDVTDKCVLEVPSANGNARPTSDTLVGNGLALSCWLAYQNDVPGSGHLYPETSRATPQPGAHSGKKSLFDAG